MRKLVYYCDSCLKLIGEEPKLEYTRKKYDDAYGYDLVYLYHFCSSKCKKEKLKFIKD